MRMTQRLSQPLRVSRRYSRFRILGNPSSLQRSRESAHRRRRRSTHPQASRSGRQVLHIPSRRCSVRFANNIKASPLLKVNNAEVIDVIVGQYDNGFWYATAPTIPWLAAEGDSMGDVMEAITSIAPALRGRLCLDIPFKLDWFFEEAST